MRRNRTLVVLSLGILFFSLIATAVQVYMQFQLQEALTAGHEITSRASELGYVTMCINNAPNVTSSCSTTLSQNQTFTCQLNTSDIDGHNVTVTRVFTTNESIFNVSTSGLVNFTPTNEDVGNHTVVFFGDDGLGCTNSMGNLTVDLVVANINDPPYLSRSLPDLSLTANTTLSAFFLTDYFADPDGDNLSFTSSTPAGITVTILSSSEVRFTSAVCVPDGELVTFTAYDPSNESAESNPIEVVVTCPSTPGGPSESGGAGAGGGGGGASDVCEPDWECQEWFDCLPSNKQWRRCYDLAACEVDRYLERACVYDGGRLACLENWLCSEWGVCEMNGSQSRSCEDLAECGTVVARPPESQSCVYAPTCSDGVKNGNETGVDCGGGCPACALIQEPGFIAVSGKLSAWILSLLIVALLVGTAIARYYRAEIAQGLAALGFLLRHRVAKDVLLDAAQRKALFERLQAFEEREQGSVEQVYDDLAMLIRAYFHEALGVPIETLPSEVGERCERLRLGRPTRELILGLCGTLRVLEGDELVADDLFVLATLEQVRTLVCLTSQYEHSEILRPMEEIPIASKMSFYDEVFARMVNVLRAVQFSQMELAHKGYLAILSRYEALSERDREEIYPVLTWVFNAARLQGEMTGARVVAKA